MSEKMHGAGKTAHPHDADPDGPGPFEDDDIDDAPVVVVRLMARPHEIRPFARAQRGVFVNLIPPTVKVTC